MTKPSEKLSTGTFPNGEPTGLWQVFSWCVGDKHADRLCWLLDLYCRVWNICPRAFWHPMRRDFMGDASKKAKLRPIQGGK